MLIVLLKTRSFNWNTWRVAYVSKGIRSCCVLNSCHQKHTGRGWGDDTINGRRVISSVPLSQQLFLQCIVSLERYGLPNHRRLECVPNSMFRQTTQETQNSALLDPRWKWNSLKDRFSKSSWRHRVSTRGTKSAYQLGREKLSPGFSENGYFHSIRFFSAILNCP